jgi:putative membrane protein
MTPSHRRFVLILALLFLAEAAALAIAPHDRHDWLLENALTVIFAVVLVASYRHLPLSRVSYGLIFLFLCLHQIGAHYTYAKVPYDAWAVALTGAR